jgi:hypothetical protein
VDQTQFDERVSRIQKIGQIIEKLPIEIRAEAFGLLKVYVIENASSDDDAPEVDQDAASDVDASGSSLFSKHTHDKPADNVRLTVAYLFEQFGSEPFTVAEIESIAADVGITVPSRVDMTLRGATDDGKQLFVSAGRGKFKPTVHGEIYLKDTYKVKKGAQTRSKAGK